MFGLNLLCVENSISCQSMIKVCILQDTVLKYLIWLWRFIQQAYNDTQLLLWKQAQSNVHCNVILNFAYNGCSPFIQVRVLHIFATQPLQPLPLYCVFAYVRCFFYFLLFCASHHHAFSCCPLVISSPLRRSAIWDINKEIHPKKVHAIHEIRSIQPVKGITFHYEWHVYHWEYTNPDEVAGTNRG